MFQTRAVLGSAKARKNQGDLTHVYDTKADVVLCGNVKPENVADEGAENIHSVPTCPTCKRRDPRMATPQTFPVASRIQF